MLEDMIEMARAHSDEDASSWASRNAPNGGPADKFGRDLGIPPCDFKGLAEYFGIPEWAIRLQDAMFHSLTDEVGTQIEWHVDVCEAFNRVRDWNPALHRVHVAILSVALVHAKTCRDLVASVLSLHEQAARGAWVSKRDWSCAAARALDAATDAQIAIIQGQKAQDYAAYSIADCAHETALWWPAAFEGAADCAYWASGESSEVERHAYLQLRDLILAALPTPVVS
ncbi:MAG: hypothetical protein AAF565_17940 [Pseudomonadota bacterium]